jgi:MFS family permease
MDVAERSAAEGLAPGGPGKGATGILGREFRALTLGVVSVVLLVAFEATAVGTAMPVAARDLHGLSLYAFGFSGYFTTSLLAMVVSGQWCDRRGPLAPLTGGVLTFAAGLVVSGTAASMGVFILGRAVQGFGGGLALVSLYVVVGRAYPEHLRPAVMASFSASWVVPSIVGPLVSGTVTEHLGWRWVFLAIPALVALPLAIMLPALRRTTSDPAVPHTSSAPNPASRRPNGAPDAAAGSQDRGGLSAQFPAPLKTTPDEEARPHAAEPRYARSPTPPKDARPEKKPSPHEDASPCAGREQPGARGCTGYAADAARARPTTTRPARRHRPEGADGGGAGAADRGGLKRRKGGRVWWAGVLAGGAVLLQYAGQDLRVLAIVPALAGSAMLVPAARRLLPRGTFRATRGLPTVVLMRGLAAGTFSAAETFIPLMLVTQRGLSPTLAGLSLAGGGLTWALGSYLQARPRFEPVRERLVQIGMLLTGGAIAAVPLALVHAVPVWIVAAAWCAAGMGMGMMISTLTVLLLKVSRPEDTGANSAALQVSDALANVVFVGAAGTVFAALGGGSIAPAATAATTAVQSHPAAFAAVFVPAAALALAASAIAPRLRTPPTTTPADVTNPANANGSSTTTSTSATAGATPSER